MKKDTSQTDEPKRGLLGTSDNISKTYRLAVPSDKGAILEVFAEVAPEVPTRIYPDNTVFIIERLVASGQSWVAIDDSGAIVGYALAEPQDALTLSLGYLGVSKRARNKHVSSTLIRKLKDTGSAIVTDVRADNKSSMVERFKHFGFVQTPTMAFFGTTKLRWDPPVTADASKTQSA